MNVKTSERCLSLLYLSLQLHLLWARWGIIQGFDAGPYLEVFEKVRWFQPLPGMHDFFYSGLPPLAPLLQRVIFLLLPQSGVSSQVLSFLSITGGFVLLRQVLKHAGVLWSIPGIVFLYGAMSVPLFIYLTTATENDSLVFFWTMLALYLSILLFWHPSAFQGEVGVYATAVSLLLLFTLAAGLLTKLTGLLLLALPFLIIGVRQPFRKLLRCGMVALIIGLSALIIAAPFYYRHYYLPEGRWYVDAMDRLQAGTLERVRRERDVDPLLFIGHMLRIPREPFWSADIPVFDSFVHSIWFQTWKRDAWLGKPPALSAYLSNLYLLLFSVILGVGTLLFLCLQRRRVSAWNHLGWVFFSVTVLFCVAQIAFVYQYPVWDWRPFKAKFIAPALLWVPFAAALMTYHALELARSEQQRKCVSAVFLFCVTLFLLLNHVVPVY